MVGVDAQDAASKFAELFSETYRRFYRRVPVGDHRLSSESIAVLRHLGGTGPLTVTEAAGHLGRSQSAMSEMIDRLETRGLLARMTDHRDRRRTLVWLSEDGHQALALSQQVLSADLLTRRLSQLEPEQRNAIIEALRLVNEGDKL